MAVGLSAKSFGIRLNALVMVGVHTCLGSDCGSNPALWMIPNFVHCMNTLPRELHCFQHTSVQRLDFCIHYCYMACPFLFYMILEVVPIPHGDSFFLRQLGLIVIPMQVLSASQGTLQRVE